MRDYDDYPDFPLVRSLSGPLAKATSESGSDDFLSMWAGQAAALGREIGAAELVKVLMDEAQAVLLRLQP